jgi:hypothetical protein
MKIVLNINKEQALEIVSHLASTSGVRIQSKYGIGAHSQIYSAKYDEESGEFEITSNALSSRSSLAEYLPKQYQEMVLA